MQGRAIPLLTPARAAVLGLLRGLAGAIGHLCLRVLIASWKVRVSGPEPPADGRPYVYCFLHGRQAGLLAYPRRRPVAVMASLSADGSLQAKVLGRMGFRIVRGSTSRRGGPALKGIVDALEAGCDAAFAVDGPRGPFGGVKAGAIVAASSSDGRLVPVSFRASSVFRPRRTWDDYRLPTPFSKVEIMRGLSIDPMAIPQEAARFALERALLCFEVR